MKAAQGRNLRLYAARAALARAASGDAIRDVFMEGDAMASGVRSVAAHLAHVGNALSGLIPGGLIGGGAFAKRGTGA